MPWRERTWMSERRELVGLVRLGAAGVSALSRDYGVSRKTAYKWLRRFEAEGWAGLEDRHRRPARSPKRTSPALESLVCELRRRHPGWGGRKIHHRLRGDGHRPVPAPSTITGILARHGILPDERRLKRDWQRFEAEHPNELWQMDFKGHFAMQSGRCHPLTILDDHSRFNICLAACGDEKARTVRTQLTNAFGSYGLPDGMLMDNGAPWGNEPSHPHTKLTAWLIRLGIQVLHGRPYHPQTQGKEERFHRTLRLEVLSQKPVWSGLSEVQSALDLWRDIYNLRRPHEALQYQVPVSRYRPSVRRMPSQLPEIDYQRGDQLRKVQVLGDISFRGHRYQIGRAFAGEPVALREAGDGVWHVYYCQQRVGLVDLALQTEV